MCFGANKIFFAWAKNAQPKAMPDQVSFQLDPEETKYLILQVKKANKISGRWMSLADLPFFIVY